MELMMKHVMVFTFLLLASQAQAGELKLEIHGKNISGQDIRLAVYATAEQFPSEELFFKSAVVKASSDSVIVTLSDIPDGKYAVAAYADANGNGRRDSNFVGIPTEDYGFSNDARGIFGPPDFKQALIDVSGQSKKQSIHLH
jgi:uncharacterized protein (DUF2141 family)